MNRIVCHFDEGDPSDSEQAKQIFARNSTKISYLLCGATYGDFSFVEMTKLYVFFLCVDKFSRDTLQCVQILVSEKCAFRLILLFKKPSIKKTHLLFYQTDFLFISIFKK